MASWSDLFGSVITGATEVFVARENASDKARQYENDVLRASVVSAEKQRERELSLVQQMQQAANQNTMKITMSLIGLAGLALAGVVTFNIFKRGK